MALCVSHTQAVVFILLGCGLVLALVLAKPCDAGGSDVTEQPEDFVLHTDYEDYIEYYFQHLYDTEDENDYDWITDYDPFNNPPCPEWNPIDGCGRTPARTKPAATTPSPSGSRTTTPPPDRHGNSVRLVCTKEEVDKAACLHGGECFALDLLDTRSAHCHCSEMWTGTRCEMMDEEFFVLTPAQVAKAGIAAGVVFVVIIVTAIVICMVIRNKKQRKSRNHTGMVLNKNGCAGAALISDRDKENNTNELDELQKCTDV